MLRLEIEWVIIKDKERKLNKNLKKELFYDNNPINISDIQYQKN